MVPSPGIGALARLLAFAIFTTVFLTNSWAQGLNQVWLVANVGAPAFSGRASIECSGTSSCTVSVSAAGTDIAGNADQFTFVHETLAGDGALVARVDRLGLTHDGAKAGLMIRESLQAGAKHASALMSADRSVAFQRRTTTGGLSATASGGVGGPPVWLKIERVGAVFSAYRSADGISWTKFASDTIAMGATVYAGLAVTSHNPSLPTTAKFSALGASSLLPAPWQAAEVGATRVPGGTFHISGTFLMQASGADIWGSRDEFRYTFQRVSGDADIVARVASVEKLHAATKAGLMIRASLDASVPHASVFNTAASGVAFQRRTTTGGLSTHTGGGASGTPVWLKLERRGERVSAFRSSDGVGWTFVGDDVISVPADFYVGMAVSSHVPTQVASAIFDRVKVRVVPVNRGPSVSLTTPASGMVTQLGTPIALSATASDTDGTVVAVDFLANGTLISSDATSPYSAGWTPTTAGVFAITAVARDNADASATSTAATVTVQAPASTLRILSFTPSPDHATAVDFYQLEVFKAGTQTSGPALVVHSLGKPPIVAGQISADVTQVLASLASGSYVAMVDAVGVGGASKSEPSPPFTR